MNKFNDLIWHDPRERIWGFHVHQELPEAEFDRALVVQEACARFLQSHGVRIDADDAIKPGYGPHLNYMWEIRVESERENVLDKMGLAVSFMALNRFGLSAYVHPLMHDPLLDTEACLLAEGRHNQANILWFSYRVKQYLEFFTHPPKDKNGKVLDTRSARVFTRPEKTAAHARGKSGMPGREFKDPHHAIKYGFHIHMDFTRDEKELGLIIFDQFMGFLIHNHLLPTSTRIYGQRENGPHLQGGWEVKFETQDTAVLRHIGLALGWLMCNRQNLPVFIHPVTWLPGDIHEELRAHEKYSMFIGKLPPLDLNFFRDQIA